jgi:hypothetical protein
MNFVGYFSKTFWVFYGDINIMGDANNLSAQQKLAIAISFLNKLEEKILLCKSD